MPDVSPPASPPALLADVHPPQAPTPHLTTPADLDRLLHAWQSRFTGGRSPSTVPLAFRDWAAHMANTPFQTAALGQAALAQWKRLAQMALGVESPIAPKPGDHRFANPAWQQRPFDLLVQAVLLGEEWCDELVRSPGGVGKPNQRIVAFTVRQFLDLISPSNVPWLNPEVIEATRATGGRNFVDGLINLLHDRSASHRGTPPAASRSAATLPSRRARWCFATR